MSIQELIALMEDHQKNGGDPFDCPSLKVPPDLKRELQSGINEIFMTEMRKRSMSNEH